MTEGFNRIILPGYNNCDNRITYSEPTWSLSREDLYSLNVFCHSFSTAHGGPRFDLFPRDLRHHVPLLLLIWPIPQCKIIATHYNIQLVECIITDHTHISIKFCSISLPAHVSSFVNLRIYRTPSWVNSTVVPGYDISPQTHCYTTTNRFSYFTTSFCYSYLHTI